MKGRNYLKDLGLDGMIILKRIKNIEWAGFMWFRIGSSGWVLITAINLRVPENMVIFLTI
jgi:hypothetical protein